MLVTVERVQRDVLRYAHGYAWRRRMNRQLGMLLREVGRDVLRAPGVCDGLAALAERIEPGSESTVDIVRDLLVAGQDAAPADRVAGALARHVADPAVAGALRLRRAVALTGLFCCVAEHRDLLDCACLRHLFAGDDPAAVLHALTGALDDCVAPLNGVWPALTN